ncbi:DnaJ-like protein subfamily A member 4 [Camelus dromedarius]|uniref:DnaJ-like protein subfamily A member 4 n=1 Tax=Camelus dromedarius TaxID=9838 RepID=A0A5N4CEC0_CAMDR|nr:DnaJ-like protein subfamily A member 4 [Camelus dromedarius]
MPRGAPAALGPREMRSHHGREPLPTPNPSKMQLSETDPKGHPGHDKTEEGHTPREKPGGDRGAQPSQSNPSGQSSRRRCPPGHPILEPAGPTDPRKGKGTAPGRRDGCRKAPSASKPSSKPPNMARGGSQNWSSGESDARPEEQAAETGDKMVKETRYYDILGFKLISQAYEVLSDPKKRDIYDQGGEQAIKEGGSGSPSFSSPMDIFDMFFGGGGRMARERRGKNVVHQLSVTLEDLYNGVTKKLALQKNVICEKCEGVGGKKGSVEKCPLCKGRGMQIHIQQIGPGMVQQIQTVCIECKGQGERINPKDRCENCSGAKVIREKKIIEVHVEKGEAAQNWHPRLVEMLHGC